MNNISLGRQRSLLVVMAACVGLAIPEGLYAADLQSTLETIMKNNAALARSQKKVENLSDSTAELLGQYRAVLEQIESMQTYNAQVKKLVDAQDAEVAGLEEQIERATNVGREMVPLMLKMIDALESFFQRFFLGGTVGEAQAFIEPVFDFRMQVAGQGINGIEASGQFLVAERSNI